MTPLDYALPALVSLAIAVTLMTAVASFLLLLLSAVYSVAERELPSIPRLLLVVAACFVSTTLFWWLASSVSPAVTP